MRDGQRGSGVTRIGLVATVVVGLAAVTLGAWLALPLWLPAVAGASMPPGFSLSELALAKRGWGLPVIRRAEVRRADCRLLLLEQLEVTLSWDALIPHLDRVRAASVQVDPACRPQGDAEAAGRSPAALPVLPRGARLEVDRLTVAGWLSQPHRLAADTADGRLRVEIAGPSLDAEAAWDPDARRARVDVRRLWVAGGASARPRKPAAPL